MSMTVVNVRRMRVLVRQVLVPMRMRMSLTSENSWMSVKVVAVLVVMKMLMFGFKMGM